MVITQDKFTTNLGLISEKIKKETIKYLQDQPIYLFLPTTFEDATNEPTINNIINTIKTLQEKYDCFDAVIIGLDTADTKQKFLEVKKKFTVIPRCEVMWNNSPRMTKLYNQMQKNLNLPLQPGKGRNMWTGLGYRFATQKGSSFVIHDCDILPEYYDESILLSLVTPIVHPEFNADFVKAYYTRLTQGPNGKQELRGRVKRLLVKPLIESLKKNYHSRDTEDYTNKTIKDYLEFVQSFHYQLSGEFAMQSNIAGDLRVQPDWGLEIGILNSLFEKRYNIAQVDLGVYDHKHSSESPNDATKGLNRMSEEVTKTMLRKMYSIMGRDILDEKKFDQVLRDYEKYAHRAIENYKQLSHNKNWEYDTLKELERVQTFKQAVKRAFDAFKKDPEEIRPLLLWDEVPREYLRELRSIVQEQNK
ncbi:hypothetical protein GOV04_01070 [Candidatus Woesearchaeota archaeon]|nr:hypothetical protein [Candidatus Woesearchaeota archaeon]